MSLSAQAAPPLRVLVSEGNSTSAREAVTILGLSGHIVEICDPNRLCLVRFSRFVRRFHHCPAMRDDPFGFLRFIEDLLAERHYDVLLPIHEQGLLFARALPRLQDKTGLALPSFENYRAAHRKAGFSRLLDALGLPQPRTQIVGSVEAVRDAVRFPCVVKTSLGTASRGVWFVRDNEDLEKALGDLAAADAFTDEVLVQDLVAGTTEKAQGVFRRGELLGFHAYRQIAVGAGGGEAIKESVRRPGMHEWLAAIGGKLAWHGALSVDYILPDDGGAACLIDCNPRLVEPMSAWLAGIDLVGLLLRISRDETPDRQPDGREGVRTHLALQALLGCALRGGTRRDLAGECWRVATRSGPYAGSTEELTPVRTDWISAVPLAATAIAMLAAPKLAGVMARSGWGAHLLDTRSTSLIEREDIS